MPDSLPDQGSVQACRAFIRTQHVMSLATSSNTGAWAAPVYYYFMDMDFFFFSNESSQHIKDALTSDMLCAASIFEDQRRFDQTRFDQIRGLQMSGKIDQVHSKIKALKAAIGYIKRFKIKAGKPDILNFIETQYHAKLFCFSPHQIFFMDNSKGFGNRQEIKL
ncbi:MAG: pyridoxamine 5'-phosphate oxidase family protein [Pseudomonadota bacterium]